MFNTQTNVIASIPDFTIVLKVLDDYSHGITLNQIKERMIVNNVYGIRTKSSRVRFYTGINATFLKFRNKDHKDLITSIFSSDLHKITKTNIAFIQMGINNELFFKLTKEVLAELLFSGRLTVNKQGFISYLHDLRRAYSDEIKWTDATIGTIAYKYLTLMKKLGFLKGSQRKEFTSFTLNEEMIILTVYLITSLNMDYSTFLDNPYSSLLLMSKDGIIEQLRRLNIQEYLTVSTLGYNMRIELKYDYKDIVNEIRKNN